MSHRSLTDLERAVLAHVVVDPDAWWEHACTCGISIGPEAALSAKVSRWAPEYVNERNRLGSEYKTRAEVEEAQAQLRSSRLQIEVDPV